MVPGIEASNDKMLQGRLFSYPDTHRHRLGTNYLQIPINCAYRTRVSNYHRDGPSTVNFNGGSAANYEPNSFSGPVENKIYSNSRNFTSGEIGRKQTSHKNCDFSQTGVLYSRVMNDQQRTKLIENLVKHMKNAKQFIQQRQVKNFYKCNAEYGTRVAEALGLNMNFPAKF